MNPFAAFVPPRFKLSLTGVVSCVLVIAGLLLGATVDMAWMALFGLGAFGPSVLRGVGVLHDLDEFQRDAARRAAFHAYLAAGVFLSAVVVAKSAGGTNLDHEAYSASSVLAVLVITYFMSRLVAFWGARGAAFRVLLAFGTFWLAFVVLSHRGVEMMVESLVAIPFFVLAFASRRWPRASGVLLLAAASLAFWFFRLARAFQGDQGAVMVILALVLPLGAMGIALAASRGDEVDRPA